MLTERHPTPDTIHEAPAFLLGIETSERTMSPAAIKSPCNANRFPFTVFLATGLKLDASNVDVALAASTMLAPGDVLTIVAPASPDAYSQPAAMAPCIIAAMTSFSVAVTDALAIALGVAPTIDHALYGAMDGGTGAARVEVMTADGCRTLSGVVRDQLMSDRCGRWRDLRGEQPSTKIRSFSEEELHGRVARARAATRAAGFDALLLFSQESLNYLTGYDSTGYVFFQCAVLTADETPIVLLTRRPDLAQARDTSTIEDIRVWYNAVDANPAEDLRVILAEKGLKASRIAIELDTYGLTPANYLLVRRELDGFCALEDGSAIIRHLRLTKSPAEIAYVRRAAELADAALLAMVEGTRPGVLDGSITAAGLTAILSGGGDMPPDGPIVNSGPRAVYGRSVGGGHTIDVEDQLMIELAATYARYNACIERTIVIGPVVPRQRHMFEACRDALLAMTEAARPGRPLGEIDDVHRRVLDAAGFGVHRYGACGYSLGNTYRPSWMDVPPLIFSGNPLVGEPGMVLFPHVMLGDTGQRLAIGIGYTILITETGCEVLSGLPLELPVRP